jgi:hypothetical protein
MMAGLESTDRSLGPALSRAHGDAVAVVLAGPLPASLTYSFAGLKIAITLA